MSQKQLSTSARIIRFVLAALFLTVASVGTTLLIMRYAKPGQFSIAERLTDAAAQPAAQQPIFAGLEPFTVTLNGGYRNRVLYVAITLRLDDQMSADIIQNHAPAVRDRVLRLLAEQDPEHIQTGDGKSALAAELGRALSAAYLPASRSPKIRDVLFTAFVVQ